MIDKYETQQKEALLLMQSKLPEYIVNCFVAAGFDTIGAIATMDVSENPENSLHVIEEFINRKHPNDPRFTFNAMASTLEFPPGHRGIVKSFVNEVKQLDEEKRAIRKRHSKATSVKGQKRRMVSNTCSTSESSPFSYTSSSSSVELTISNPADVMSNIRQQVVKWQRRHRSQKVRDLKEHVHYEVKVKHADEVHSSASVECKLCGKSYSLGQGKSNKPIISNWTRHVVACLDSKCTSKANPGRRLQTYFSVPSSVDASSGSTSQLLSVSPELHSGRSAISVDSEPDDDLVERRGVIPTPILSSFQLASHGEQETETTSNNHHFRLSPPN